MILFICRIFVLYLYLHLSWCSFIVKTQVFFEKWRLPTLNNDYRLFSDGSGTQNPGFYSWTGWTRFFLQLSPNCLKYYQTWGQKINQIQEKPLLFVKTGWFWGSDPSLGNLFYEVWIKFFQRTLLLSKYSVLILTYIFIFNCYRRPYIFYLNSH